MCTSGSSYFSFMVSTIALVFDGILLDQQSRLSGGHENHVVHERLYVYAEFSESGVSRALYTTVGSPPSGLPSSVAHSHFSVSQISPQHAVEIIYGVLRPALRREVILHLLQLWHRVSLRAPDQHPFHGFA
ncbi:hypothetical protein EVAR_44235_1 [Eumeta japonica]|uniref:Secreted protein n=1 Tax=Eumeta variegata TaxID=151549 RepID=A0A4C1XCI0_EUMVA|nr:hypothetical protein EVAR_44235_1 [Eumeta japonica]